ncbi:MAG: c-type cytochrome domain-containing protein [Planctomycetaceae bacterium]
MMVSVSNQLPKRRGLFAVHASVAGLLLLTSSPASGDELQQLAEQGTAIVKAHCYGCHGERFNGSAQFNVMDSVALLDHGFVIKDNATDSPMWQRIDAGEMPPPDSGVPPLNDDEKLIVQRWIAAGVPQIQRQQRPFKPYSAVIGDIHADLMQASRDDRPYYRYFSLTHLNNNYAQVNDFDLRLYRAAFAKAINSLSYESDIYIPEFIDAEQTVFRIDMRRLGWDFDTWKWLIGKYPYGIHYHNGDDEALAGLDEQIDHLSGTDLCWMRADWFINAATRPPIYDRFLKIPDHVDELEQRLNVSFTKNYRDNRIARGGFATSGVSNGNRLVERHPAVHGYYWKSYDFKDKGASGNLFRLPLGPVFPENDYPNLAFEHDGGEMIFSLPNGLQGYMLTDGKGGKIDKGPIEVVRDSREVSGTPEVLNGLSCMHCHRHGMIDFRDTVREGTGVFGEAKRKVRNIYPEAEAMNRIVEGDRRRFLNAVEQCVAPFLRVGDGAGREITEFAEPVGAVARFYQRDLTPETAACELGIPSPDQLSTMIGANRELIRLGLGPLVNGDTIKRADWESQEAFVSPYQETARILGLATPVN